MAAGAVHDVIQAAELRLIVAAPLVGLHGGADAGAWAGVAEAWRGRGGGVGGRWVKRRGRVVGWVVGFVYAAYMRGVRPCKGQPVMTGAAAQTPHIR